MKSLLYQSRSAPQRTLGLITLMLVLLLLAGCNNQQSSTIPTPDLEILAPTATGVTARVEVVIVVVTATAAPAPSATVAPTPEPAATATSASAEETGGTTAEQPAAQPTSVPTEGAPTEGAGSGQAQAQAMSNQELINMGEGIYTDECASCHQLNGEGTDIYPALNQSSVLESGDPTQAIQIVINGRGQMPAFEDTLSNQQIAAVLSYERNAWQNDNSVVRVAQVRQVRQGGSATTSQAQEADRASTDTASTDTASETPTAEATAAPPEPTATAGPDETATSETEPPAEPDAAAASAGNEATQSDQDLIASGQRLYAVNCASCHQLSGQGNTTYPALNGSAMLTADDPTAAINIVLHGRGEMPAFEGTLSTEEIAAVLSHERNAWDNNASVVTVEQVEELQQEGQDAAAVDATGAPTTAATGEVTGTATTAGTVTDTVTGTVTGTVETTATTAPEVTPTVAMTPTPATGTTTTTGDAGGPAAPLTWTPPVTVTPLLPTTEISGTAMTVTPAVTTTTSGGAGGPNVSLTWTPAREVTPLLPTTESSTTTMTRTPVPQTTVVATGTITATATTTPTAAGTAPPAPTDEEENGEGGEESTGATAANEEELLRMGEEIYAINCASCHQLSGEGTSVYPALNGSAMLTADDPTDAINIVLQGEGEMPGFEDLLSTEEIAAVLSHERNAWDNNASVVTVAEVAEVQGSSGN